MKGQTFLVAIAFALGVPTIGTSQTFLNGNFEITTATVDQINLNNTTFTSLMSNTFAFGTWSAGTGNMDIIRTASYGLGPQSGIWYVSLTSGGTDRITLRLNTALVAGTSYSMSFYDNFWASIPTEVVRVGVSTLNNTIGTNVYVGGMPSSTAWTLRTFSFTAPVAGSYISVELGGVASGGIWTKVDNFTMGVILPADDILLGADVQKSTQTVQVKGHVQYGPSLKSSWLERSRDGVEFETVGEIPSPINSPKVDFSIEDHLLTTGVQFYRIRMEDLDGNLHYSKWIEVNAEYTEPELLAYPNPTSGSVNLLYKHPVVGEDSEVEVFDLSGGHVLSHRFGAEDLAHELDLSNLEPGMYLVQVRTGSVRRTTKVVVER